MNGRDYGFLRPSERKFVDSDGERGGARLRGVRYQLKKGPASSEGLQEALESIRADLVRIERFYTTIREQPGGTYDWHDRVLPLVADELFELEEHLGALRHKAEQDTLNYTRQELSSAFAVPLREGLTELEKKDKGGIGPREVLATLRGSEDENEELAADFDELQARRQGLLTLLKDRELREINDWILANEGRKLPDRKKKGNNWKWWTRRYLKTELGVVHESGWGYEMTERGETVHRALQQLRDSDFVRQFEENGEWDIAALTLLENHFDTERWEDD